MSWEMHELAKKIADGWYAELEETRKRNAVLGRENVKLRWLVRHLYEYRQLYFKTGIYPTDHGVTEQYMRELGVEVQ